jgi:cytochrome c oxidase assembly factor CtaG
MSSQQLRQRKSVPTTNASPSSPSKGTSVVVNDPSVELHDHDLRNRSVAVHPFVSEHFIDALYKPHTATVLLAVIVSIVYFAFIRDDLTLSTAATVKRGIVAVIAVFLVYCVVQFRDGIILRPHPAFWRLVTGAGLVYLLFLTFFCFQVHLSFNFILILTVTR